MLGVHSAVSTGSVDTVCWADKTYDKGRTSEIKLSTIQQTTAKEKTVYLNWIVCRGKKGLLGEQELLVVSNLMMDFRKPKGFLLAGLKTFHIQLACDLCTYNLLWHSMCSVTTKLDSVFWMLKTKHKTQEEWVKGICWAEKQ